MNIMLVVHATGGKSSNRTQVRSSVVENSSVTRGSRGNTAQSSPRSTRGRSMGDVLTKRLVSRFTKATGSAELGKQAAREAANLFKGNKQFNQTSYTQKELDDFVSTAERLLR